MGGGGDVVVDVFEVLAVFGGDAKRRGAAIRSVGGSVLLAALFRS